MICDECQALKQWKECERCEGRGGWTEYDEEFLEPEWEQCPECGGDEGCWVCPRWAKGKHDNALQLE
jgi:DnaJ-class molecular chaperone